MKNNNKESGYMQMQPTTVTERINHGKYENYKEQFHRLKKALGNGFYLEAIFIEYAILEDRADAVLSYEGNEIIPKNEREFISFARKKNRIIKLSEKKNSITGRFFSQEFMEQVFNWVNRRNAVIHGLLKRTMTADELQSFALEGKMLCETFRNKTRSYKRRVNKLKAVEK